MADVTNYTKIYNVDTEVVLNKTRVVVGTEAMNAGVNSNNMKYYLYWGTPLNQYMLMQTLGYIDRGLNAEPGSNVFKIHLSFSTLITMFIRIKRGTSADKQATPLVVLFGVLEFLVVLVDYYHSFLEHYFEVVWENNTQSCGSFCTYCRNEHLHFTGRFTQAKNKCVLNTVVLAKGGPLHWREFIKVLKVHKAEFTKVTCQALS